jgi:hypothetical protein
MQKQEETKNANSCQGKIFTFISFYFLFYLKFWTIICLALQELFHFFVFNYHIYSLYILFV